MDKFIFDAQLFASSTTVSGASVFSATVNGTTTYYDAVSDLTTTNVGSATSITLLSDCTVTDSSTVTISSTCTLDLNGHTLSGLGSTSAAGVKIETNGNLTVKDSSSGSTGKIVVTKSGFVVAGTMTL